MKFLAFFIVLIFSSLLGANQYNGNCLVKSSSCWKDWHYGPEPVKMEAPYIDKDEAVINFVEFTKKELEEKKKCPSCCIRCG